MHKSNFVRAGRAPAQQRRGPVDPLLRPPRAEDAWNEVLAGVRQTGLPAHPWSHPFVYLAAKHTGLLEAFSPGNDNRLTFCQWFRVYEIALRREGEQQLEWLQWLQGELEQRRAAAAKDAVTREEVSSPGEDGRLALESSAEEVIGESETSEPSDSSLPGEAAESQLGAMRDMLDLEAAASSGSLDLFDTQEEANADPDEMMNEQVFEAQEMAF